MSAMTNVIRIPAWSHDGDSHGQKRATTSYTNKGTLIQQYWFVCCGNCCVDGHTKKKVFSFFSIIIFICSVLSWLMAFWSRTYVTVFTV
jgi:hypothetical protein